MPKRRADSLDRITGTEGWKETTGADAAMDAEWLAWYRGRVAWREAVRELRLQLRRSRKLARTRRQAAVLDGDAARTLSPPAPAPRARRQRGLRYDPQDDRGLFATEPSRAPAAPVPLEGLGEETTSPEVRRGTGTSP